MLRSFPKPLGRGYPPTPEVCGFQGSSPEDFPIVVFVGLESEGEIDGGKLMNPPSGSLT